MERLLCPGGPHRILFSLNLTFVIFCDCFILFCTLFLKISCLLYFLWHWSLLLLAVFLWLWWLGATLHRSAWASHCGGFSCCGEQVLGSWVSVVAARGLWSAGSVVVVHGLSCSVLCRIIPYEGLNPCPLHWQLDSQPVDHQGSPITAYLDASVCQHFHPQVLASHCPQEALSTPRAPHFYVHCWLLYFHLQPSLLTESPDIFTPLFPGHWAALLSPHT